MSKPAQVIVADSALPEASKGDRLPLEPPRRSLYRKYEGSILGGLAVCAAIGIWEAFWSAGKISPLFFTGPSAVVKRFAEEWTQGRLKSDMAYSGTNFLIGVGLAIAAGVALGVI